MQFEGRVRGLIPPRKLAELLAPGSAGAVSAAMMLPSLSATLSAPGLRPAASSPGLGLRPAASSPGLGLRPASSPVRPTTASSTASAARAARNGARPMSAYAESMLIGGGGYKLQMQSKHSEVSQAIAGQSTQNTHSRTPKPQLPIATRPQQLTLSRSDGTLAATF